MNIKYLSFLYILTTFSALACDTPMRDDTDSSVKRTANQNSEENAEKRSGKVKNRLERKITDWYEQYADEFARSGYNQQSVSECFNGYNIEQFQIVTGWLDQTQILDRTFKGNAFKQGVFIGLLKCAAFSLNLDQFRQLVKWGNDSQAWNTCRGINDAYVLVKIIALYKLRFKENNGIGFHKIESDEDEDDLPAGQDSLLVRLNQIEVWLKRTFIWDKCKSVTCLASVINSTSTYTNNQFHEMESWLKAIDFQSKEVSISAVQNLVPFGRFTFAFQPSKCKVDHPRIFEHYKLSFILFDVLCLGSQMDDHNLRERLLTYNNETVLYEIADLYGQKSDFYQHYKKFGFGKSRLP